MFPWSVIHCPGRKKRFTAFWPWNMASVNWCKLFSAIRRSANTFAHNLVTSASLAKAAEPTEMPSGAWTWPKKPCSGWRADRDAVWAQICLRSILLPPLLLLPQPPPQQWRTCIQDFEKGAKGRTPKASRSRHRGVGAGGLPLPLGKGSGTPPPQKFCFIFLNENGVLVHCF